MESEADIILGLGGVVGLYSSWYAFSIGVFTRQFLFTLLPPYSEPPTAIVAV